MEGEDGTPGCGEVDTVVDLPTLEKEFRVCGYTANAVRYPLSEAAFLWLCKFNGADPAKAPRAWRYAPNAEMKRILERNAARPVV